MPDYTFNTRPVYVPGDTVVGDGVVYAVVHATGNTITFTATVESEGPGRAHACPRRRVPPAHRG